MSSLDQLISGANSLYQNFTSINSFSSAVSAVSSVGSLFSAGSVLTLGSMDFKDLEIPESIRVCSSAAIDEKQFPGGAKHLDILGVFYEPISWNALLIGANAKSRMRELQSLVDAKAEVTLAFSDMSFQVVPEKVEFEIKGPYQIGYSITCRVATGTNTTSSTSLFSSITSDIDSALGIDLSSTLSDVSSAIKAVQPVLSTAVNLTGGSSTALKLLGYVQAAGNVTEGALRASEGEVAGFSQMLGSVSATSTLKNALTGLATATSNLATLGTVNGYLGRATNSLGDVSS